MSAPTGSLIAAVAERHINDHRVRKVIELLATAPDKCGGVSRLASAVSLSPSHLRRLFRAETGRPLRDFLIEHRLRLAAHLLVTSQRGVKQAMFDSGMTDPSHFGRKFKAMFGHSPNRYKQLFSAQ